MSTRTLCLDLLVLISAAFPGQAFRLMLARARSFSIALLAVAALAWAVTPIDGLFKNPQAFHWYQVSLVFGLLVPLVEYLVGATAMLARRRRPGRIALHDRAQVGLTAVLAAIGAATAEEILFRGIALRTLLDEFGWPVWAAVALTATLYALNHLYFGWLTVAQKLVTGVGLGLLFVWSGQSLIVPLLAHVMQNLVVLVVLPRLARAK